MAASEDYMPQSETDFAAWMANFAAKAPEHKNALVLTGAEMTQIADDAATVQTVVSGGEQFRASASEFTNYKRIIIFGGANDPTPDFPIINAPDAPAAPKAGIRERTRSLVRRIKSAADYNESIGADLGILPPKSESISPNDMKPTLKVRVLPGGQLEITFTRGKTGGINLQMQQGDDTDWTTLGNYGQSPVVITVAPKEKGKPEKIRLRGRYLEGNTAVGQLSDTVNVVTEP